MQHTIPENLISLSEAAKITPGRPHTSTIFRWHMHGVRGVKLEARRYGGKIFTSQQWLDDFSRILAQEAQNQHPTVELHAAVTSRPGKRTPEQRKAAVQNAVDSLKARGL